MGTSASEAATIDSVLQKVAEYHPAPDLELVQRAYEFSKEAHEGQMRKSGEPYITHPVAVADIVATLKLDESSLCAALLHDTVEDTGVTLEEVSELFGAEIAEIVDGVTKLGQVKFNTREQRQAENFRKMLVAMSKDIRVILVKLCDRIHNMRTLKHMKPEKQEPIAQETLEIYAPLANRLGISWVKTELEDLAFRFIHGDDYYELVEKVASKRNERLSYTEGVVEILEETMKEHGVEATVSGRPKHLYSIWRKMRAQKIDYDQVYDAIAFRIIVESITKCYEALGIIHSRWKPIPGRFKDYIALSKPNLYRSLHTAVIGPQGARIEIQIRTAEMHRVAEEGIAAHWKYKEGASLSLKDEQRFSWLKQLLEWQQELKDPTEFLDTVKVDLFNDEVYVFTPNGDVKVFPRGATAVDFAYSIHSDVGHHCTGARVGGVMVPLSHKLRNGDHVEIITRKNQRPSADWLKFVRTSRAKNRIRAFIRKEQRERSCEIGREMLASELRKCSMSVSRFIKQPGFEPALKTLGSRGHVNSVEDLYVQIGYGKLEPQEVIEKVLPGEQRPEPGAEPRSDGRVISLLRNLSRKKSAVRVDGIEDVMVRYAKCCLPVPGDRIVGFVTRGRGVTVHTLDCHHVEQSDPARRLDVLWEVNSSKGHPISIRVLCDNTPGLLANISQSITNGGVNISQAHCRVLEDQNALNVFHVEVENLSQLQSVMKNIRRIKGVHSVERMRS